MSTKTTKPEEKGFFEKVKETIEELWDETKDKAEDLKGCRPGHTYDNLKNKVTSYEI